MVALHDLAQAGSHAVAHTRMATESAVNPGGAHPFSTGRDQCLVHNGSLSNHASLRRMLMREGMTFAKLAKLFRDNPEALPSDLVDPSKASEMAAKNTGISRMIICCWGFTALPALRALI